MQLAQQHPQVKEVAGCPFLTVGESSVTLTVQVWCADAGVTGQVQCDLIDLPRRASRSKASRFHSPTIISFLRTRRQVQKQDPVAGRFAGMIQAYVSCPGHHTYCVFPQTLQSPAHDRTARASLLAVDLGAGAANGQRLRGEGESSRACLSDQALTTPHELAVGCLSLYTLVWRPPASGGHLVVPSNQRRFPQPLIQ